MVSHKIQTRLNRQPPLITPKGLQLKKILQQSSERKNQNRDKFDNLINNTGMIRGQWIKENKLQSICYGSGIAISKRIVLTCAHSIFQEAKQLTCNSVSFIPSHKEGIFKKNEKIYTSSNQDYIKLKLLKQGQKFGRYPISQDLALVYLSQDLQLDQFPYVGVENTNQIPEKSKIMICGYPSLGFYRCSDLKKIDFARAPLFGQLLDIFGDMIYHKLDTKTGHSGSAIVSIGTQTGEPTVIGVHTHKGTKKNSGVYLNNLNLKRLAKYEVQLGLAHREYQMDIKFPNSIKRQVWNQLNEDQKKRFRNRRQYYQEMGGKIEIVQQSDNQEQSMELNKSIIISQKSSQKSDDYPQISKMHNFYQQEANQQIKENQNLMNENIILRQKITKNLPYIKNKNILTHFLQIQKHLLTICNELDEKQDKFKLKGSKIRQEAKKILSNHQETLIQVKEQHDRYGDFGIICRKFPSAEEHLKDAYLIKASKHTQQLIQIGQ